MITGINHVTLSVRSLAESFDFYTNILGFKPLMRKSKSAYFLAGDLWFCIEDVEFPPTCATQFPEYCASQFP